MRYFVRAASKFAHPEVEAVFRGCARNNTRGDTPEFQESSLSPRRHDLIVPRVRFSTADAGIKLKSHRTLRERGKRGKGKAK